MSYLLSAILFTFFLYFQTSTIYGGDGGDFLATAVSGGYAHAPGYPLYSLLSYLLSLLPGDVTWNIILLSSIPAALTLLFIYKIIFKLTHSNFASIIATSTLAFTYIFWLYAIVPEVFVLAGLFMSSITYILLKWKETSSPTYFFASIFVFILSLTHHHIILFLLPAYVIFVWMNKDLLPQKNTKNAIRLSLVSLAGALPYIWIPFVAFLTPQYYWADPSTFSGFMKIVTRAYYGTFIAIQDYNQTIFTRFKQIPILTDFYIDDFLLPTCIVAILGAYWLFRKNRHYFTLIVSAFLLSGPLFFLYASYDHSTPYKEAVAERFLLPSYLYLTILFGCGIAFIHNELKNRLSTLKPLIVMLIMSGFLLIPARIFLLNYFKLAPLKNDHTAENFAQDLLRSSTPGKPAIFLLQNDNSLFNSQYIHIKDRETYKNQIPLNPAELTSGFSTPIIRKWYPHIKISSPGQYHPTSVFLRDNYDNFEIYTDIKPDNIEIIEELKGGKWLPYGLVFRFYKAEDLPPVETIVKANARLWNEVYSNPMEGSLKDYKNLQLEHVLEFYQFGQVRSGIFALEQGFFEEAIERFDAYQEIAPTFKMDLALISTAEAYVALGQCEKAEPFIPTISKSETEKAYNTMIQYHQTCTKDTAKISFWTKKLLKFEEQNNIGLEGL